VQLADLARPIRPACVLVGAALVALCAPVAAGAAETKISATEANLHFGTAIALGGVSITADYLVVGLPGAKDCSLNPDNGRVEFWERDGESWEKVDCQDADYDVNKLRSEYGAAVSIYGDQALVGEPGEWGGRFEGGRAHLHERHTSGDSVSWVHQLYYTDSLGDSDFGRSVSMAATNRWIAGGPCNPFYASASCVGDASVSDHTLVPAGGDTADDFGWSVDVWGEDAIVGAPGDTLLGDDAGSAYVYHHSSGVWSLQQKLVAPDGDDDHRFGTAVGISGDLAVVGAPGWGSGRGKLYFYHRTGSTWALVFPYAPPESDWIRRLGTTIYQYFGAVLAGAPYSRVGTQDQAGKVLAFTWDNGASVWRYRGQRSPNDSYPYLWWGDKAITAWQDKVAIGAPRDSQIAAYAGSIYLLDAGDIWGHIFSDTFDRGTDRWSVKVP